MPSRRWCLSLLVRDGPGIRPWAVLENMTPSIGKAASTGVTVAKAFAQDVPQHKVRLRRQAVACCPRRRHCPAVPRKPLQRSFDAPTACSSHIATSVATPFGRAPRNWALPCRAMRTCRSRCWPSSPTLAPASNVASHRQPSLSAHASPLWAPPLGQWPLNPAVRTENPVT